MLQDVGQPPLQDLVMKKTQKWSFGCNLIVMYRVQRRANTANV